MTFFCKFLWRYYNLIISFQGAPWFVNHKKKQQEKKTNTEIVPEMKQRRIFFTKKHDRKHHRAFLALGMVQTCFVPSADGKRQTVMLFSPAKKKDLFFSLSTKILNSVSMRASVIPGNDDMIIFLIFCCSWLVCKGWIRKKKFRRHA